MSLSERFRLLLTVKGTSHQIALAFGVGVFIGMSPFLGLHTIMALVVAYVFRLNKLVTLAGAYVTNPWTIIPIYTFGTWMGIKITGTDKVLSSIDFHKVNIINIFRALKELLWPFFAGTLVLGTVSGILSYFLLYMVLKRIRKV